MVKSTMMDINKYMNIQQNPAFAVRPLYLWSPPVLGDTQQLVAWLFSERIVAITCVW